MARQGGGGLRRLLRPRQGRRHSCAGLGTGLDRWGGLVVDGCVGSAHAKGGGRQPRSCDEGGDPRARGAGLRPRS